VPERIPPARARRIRAAERKVQARQQAQQDQEAADIARRVYHAAREMKAGDEPEPLPLAIFAPLTIAAETAAPVLLHILGRELTEENAIEAAAYLVAGFREMVVALYPEHFERWRSIADAEVPQDAGSE
jgi:hypothetical protein